MELEIIREKEELYHRVLVELENKDINKIVDERLELQRKEIEEEVKKEIECDKIKCRHYLDVLYELQNEIQSTIEKEEEVVEENHNEEI